MGRKCSCSSLCSCSITLLATAHLGVLHFFTVTHVSLSLFLFGLSTHMLHEICFLSSICALCNLCLQCPCVIPLLFVSLAPPGEIPGPSFALLYNCFPCTLSTLIPSLCLFISFSHVSSLFPLVPQMAGITKDMCSADWPCNLSSSLSLLIPLSLSSHPSLSLTHSPYSACCHSGAELLIALVLRTTAY